MRTRFFFDECGVFTPLLVIFLFEKGKKHWCEHFCLHFFMKFHKLLAKVVACFFLLWQKFLFLRCTNV